MGYGKYLIEHFADEDAIAVDGFDDCIIGLSLDAQNIVYSLSSILRKLSIANSWSIEESSDHFFLEIKHLFDIHEGQPNAPILVNLTANEWFSPYSTRTFKEQNNPYPVDDDILKIVKRLMNKK
jgi:hypothetical protein